MGFGNPGVVKLRFDNAKVQGWYCFAGPDRGYLTAYLTCTTRSRHQINSGPSPKVCPSSRELEVGLADDLHEG